MLKGIDFPPQPPKGIASVSQEGNEDASGGGSSSEVDPSILEIEQAPRSFGEEARHARAIAASREVSTEGMSIAEQQLEATKALKNSGKAPEGAKSLAQEQAEMLAGLGVTAPSGKNSRDKARRTRGKGKKAELNPDPAEEDSPSTDNLTEHARRMQEEIDATQGTAPREGGKNSLQEANDALAIDISNNNKLTDRTRNLVRLNLIHAQDFHAYTRSHMFGLGVTKAQKDAFSAIEVQVADNATRVLEALASTESAQVLSELLASLTAQLEKLGEFILSAEDTQTPETSQELGKDTGFGDIARRAGVEQEETVIGRGEQKRATKERKQTKSKDSLRITPEDATKAELRAAMKAGVEELTVRQRLSKWAEKSGSTKEFYTDGPELLATAESTKENYLVALRKYQRNRSLLDAGTERLGIKSADKDKGTAQLRDLKNEWIKARADVAKARLDSVTEHRTKRDDAVDLRGGPTRDELEAEQAHEEKRRQALWDSMTEEQRAEAREGVDKTEWAERGIGTERPKTRERGTDAVTARFQRRYVLKEAAFGAAQEEAQARMEALNSRDKNLEGVFKAYQNLPPKVKIAISGVGLATGTIAAYGAITGVSLVAGIAMIPILAGTAAGMAMRWRADNLRLEAEKGRALGMHETEEGRVKLSKIEAAQQELQRKASFTTFSGLGGMISNFFAKQGLKGTREKAGSTLGQRDAVGNVGGAFTGSVADADTLAGLSKNLDTAHGKLSQAGAVEGVATFAGSVVGGVAGGAAYGEGVHFASEHSAGLVQGMHDQFDKLTNHHATPASASSPSGQAETLKVVVGDKTTSASGPEASASTHTTSGGETTTSTPDASPSASGSGEATSAVSGSTSSTLPTGPDGMMSSVSINASGEGIGQMFVDLRHELSADTTASPELQQLLHTNPNVLAHQIHATDGVDSLRVHEGDQLFVDKHQDVWFKAEGKAPELAFKHVDATPGVPAHYEAQTLHGTMVPPTHHDSTPVASTQPKIETAPADSSSVTISSGESVPADSGVAVSTGPESVTVNGVTVTGGDHGVLTASPSTEGTPTTSPEQPAQTPEPQVASPATAEPTQPPHDIAPKAPESVTPPTESGVTPPVLAGGPPHPFAAPDAPPLLNAHGVNLNQPQILMSGDKLWAHGIDSNDSFTRAVAYSSELAKAGAQNTNVYFVARDFDMFGQPFLAVRMVFTQPGSAPQMAPFGSGADLGPQFTMPPIPDDANFTLVPSK